jgi:hypothetical protein
MVPKTKQKRNYAYWADVYNQNNVIANTETTPQTPITGMYSAWAPETVSGVGSVTKMRSAGEKTETTPIATVGETGSGAGEYSVWADSSNDTDTTPTAEESGFAKWLEGNEEYKSAVAKAISEYDRTRATYGAQGEALARSGLVGSGYSAWADSQAYAKMQDAKENARNVGYAAWLGEEEQKKKDQLKAEKEKTAKEEEIKTQTSAILTWANENGLEEIPSLQIPLLKARGFSDEAIVAAQNTFAEIKKAETDAANKAFMDSLTAFNTTGDAVSFLAANGVNVEGMTDDEIAQNTNALVDAKLADGTIDKVTASAYYRDTSIFDDDLTGKSYGKIGEKLEKATKDASGFYKAGKMTDEDYNAVLESIINQIGGANVSVRWDSNGVADSDVTFTYAVNGKKYTIIADWGGNFRISKDSTIAALNAIYDKQTGSKSDIVYYNGKVYYHYKDNASGDRLWTEIKAKADGKGQKAEDENLYMAAIAAYMSRPGNGERNAKANGSESINLAPGALGTTPK